MKRFKIFSSQLRTGMVALVLCGAAGGCATGPDATITGAKADRHDADSRPALSAAIRPPLTGAELYAINCNRCHPERYPTERNVPEWTTILTHMRVRANLPAAQAREILKYLQENSGS